ncbi:cbb3-type cytochrome oxidase assembly protein CcoS [Shewanella youngdeokensis]|uniref:Cbb3-type cytochrome oxidase assembly protein CcoS n=1 Tax=Shewanella youngdeokensis TaxID=2999068 RepID=A0ABZ0JTT1_9GAMM|nr:cbb3-type cytochrome oxidase assembly protein CcoS [Shewanella sp. DAU334]
MSIIYVLIPIAIIFVMIAVCIFTWAVQTDQFDDLDKHSISILFDDDKQTERPQVSQQSTTESYIGNKKDKNE